MIFLKSTSVINVVLILLLSVFLTAAGFSYQLVSQVSANLAGEDEAFLLLLLYGGMVFSVFLLLLSVFWMHRHHYMLPIQSIESHIKRVDLNNPELEILEVDERSKLSELTVGINMLLYRIRHYTREYKKDQLKLKEMNQKLENSLYISQSAQNGLMLQKNQFEALFKNSTDAILILNHHRQVIALNDTFTHLFGYYFEDLKFKDPDAILAVPQQIDEARSYTEQLFNGVSYDLETERLNHTGEIRDVSMKGVPIRVGDEVVGAYQIYNDISIRKRSEYELKFLSYHDQLTGLYNRRFFEVELDRLDTERNLPMTIVICDVNGLKITNDAFGHKMGDRLLMKTADILRSICRSEDIIARWGGDEFVILLPKTDQKTAAKFVERIKYASRDEKVDSIMISISIGCAVKNDPDEITAEVFKDAENQMYSNKLYEGPSMRGQIIQAILNTLHEKNPREELHSRRVSHLCGELATCYGFSETRVEAIKTFGLMHDIGKIAIYEHLLNKAGHLSEDEWMDMKRHPEIGYRILSTVNDMAEIADLTLAHHENWDGTGYPKGLKGEQIPLESRMIQLADAYDAMTSDRPYRKALLSHVAVNEIIRNAGKQFDPNLSRIFVEDVLKMSWYNRSELECQNQLESLN